MSEYRQYPVIVEQTRRGLVWVEALTPDDAASYMGYVIADGEYDWPDTDAIEYGHRAAQPEEWDWQDHVYRADDHCGDGGYCAEPEGPRLPDGRFESLQERRRLNALYEATWQKIGPAYTEAVAR